MVGRLCRGHSPKFRVLIAAVLLSCGLHGCGKGKSGDGLLGTPSGADNSSSSSSNGSNNQGNIYGTPTGKPVLTADPNAQSQKPAFPEQTRAQEYRSAFSVQTQLITSRLNLPVGMAHLPDGRWLIAEKSGKLVTVTTKGVISTPIQGMPAVVNSDQGGLLDVSLDPKFATNRYVYLSFAEDRGDGKNATSVGRGVLSTDETRLDNWQVIYRQTPAWKSLKHFGSRLAWDRNGLLYITLGDRSELDARALAQDVSTALGKIIRIKPDGSIPWDNPLAGKSNALSEVWSYGHSNPQGAAIHPQTGELWTSEQGLQGGDEINRVQPGKNYGWPLISYGEDSDDKPIGSGITAKNGMEQPVYYFDPVIEPSGINFYQGKLFTGWENNLLIGSLNPGGLVRLIFQDNKVIGEERVVAQLGRIRDVDLASDGALWVISDSGQLNRLIPKL